jgi:hypothetical protein
MAERPRLSPGLLEKATLPVLREWPAADVTALAVVLAAEVRLSWAEVARLRALLPAACRQHPEAVVTDGDTSCTLAHLARRLEEGGADEEAD